MTQSVSVLDMLGVWGAGKLSCYFWFPYSKYTSVDSMWFGSGYDQNRLRQPGNFPALPGLVSEVAQHHFHPNPLAKLLQRPHSSRGRDLNQWWWKKCYHLTKRPMGAGTVWHLTVRTICHRHYYVPSMEPECFAIIMPHSLHSLWECHSSGCLQKKGRQIQEVTQNHMEEAPGVSDSGPDMSLSHEETRKQNSIRELHQALSSCQARSPCRLQSLLHPSPSTPKLGECVFAREIGNICEARQHRKMLCREICMPAGVQKAS